MGLFLYSDICYGWCEPDYSKYLDMDSLYNLYNNLQIYTTETNHSHPISIIYGEKCYLDNETGHICIDDANKQLVKDAYEKWCKVLDIKPDHSELQYYSVLSGDLDFSEFEGYII